VFRSSRWTRWGRWPKLLRWWDSRMRRRVQCPASTRRTEPSRQSDRCRPQSRHSWTTGHADRQTRIHHSPRFTISPSSHQSSLLRLLFNQPILTVSTQSACIKSSVVCWHYFLPDLTLASHPQNITGPRLVPNYTASRQKHECLNNLPELYPVYTTKLACRCSLIV